MERIFFLIVLKYKHYIDYVCDHENLISSVYRTKQFPTNNKGDNKLVTPPLLLCYVIPSSKITGSSPIRAATTFDLCSLTID